jgi:hypothetical protein
MKIDIASIKKAFILYFCNIDFIKQKTKCLDIDMNHKAKYHAQILLYSRAKLLSVKKEGEY